MTYGGVDDYLFRKLIDDGGRQFLLLRFILGGQLQCFFPDIVHGAVACVALIPCTAVAILLWGYVLSRCKMQLAPTVGTVQQPGEQPLPFRLLCGAVLTKI